MKVLTGPPGPDDQDPDNDPFPAKFVCIGPIGMGHDPIVKEFNGDFSWCPSCDKIDHMTCQCCFPSE